MNYRQFKDKILNYEKLASANPGAYKSRVLMMMMLGYAYVGFILLLGLVGIACIILLMMANRHHVNGAEIKILLCLGIYEFAVLSALFVKIPPPEGLELKPEEVPELFKVIEEIREKTNSPHIRKVVLDDEFNAAVCQIPRFGLLGGTSHYLILGFPLMASITPDQFKAILAHEFGHVSRDHSKFSCWIYKVRRTWTTLAETCSGGVAKFIVHPFAKWYFPRLSAVTFVFSRQHEYEADATAAKIAGPDTAAEALLSIEIQARKFTDAVVKPVWEKSKTMETPDFSLHEIILKEMASPVSHEKTEEYRSKCLKRKTMISDTHPGMEDRVRAIGGAHPSTSDRIDTLVQRLKSSTPLETSAAKEYFRDFLGNLVSKLDERWKVMCTPEWSHSFKSAGEARKKLEELKKSEVLQTDMDKRIDIALLTENLDGADRALELFREIMRDFPDSPIAIYSVGRLLIQKDDEEGINLIKKAISKDITLMPYGVNIVSPYLTENGREDELETWYTMEEDNTKKVIKAVKDLETFTYRHNYTSPVVEHEVIDKTVKILLDCKGVSRAWLVKKDIHGEGEYQHIYLLAFESKALRLSDENLVNKIAMGLSFFPYRIFVMQLGSFDIGHMRLKKKLKAVPGSMIFQR